MKFLLEPPLVLTDEERRDAGGDDRKDRIPEEHDERGKDSRGWSGRHEIAVSDRRACRERQPQPVRIGEHVRLEPIKSRTRDGHQTGRNYQRRDHMPPAHPAQPQHGQTQEYYRANTGSQQPFDA